MIQFVVAKFWIGFQQADGVSPKTSRVPQYSCAHPPATMSTGTFLRWMEAGWRVEEGVSALINRKRWLPLELNSWSELENTNGRANKNFS